MASQLGLQTGEAARVHMRGLQCSSMSSDAVDFVLRPVGTIRSTIKERSEAPKQGSEGAPDVWLEIEPFAADACDGLAVGAEVMVITWLHRGLRDVLKVHPRSDPQRRLTGVFATRSPDRPNPLGLHRVRIKEITKHQLRVGPMEAIDGTPVVDIKPVLCGDEGF